MSTTVSEELTARINALGGDVVKTFVLDTNVLLHDPQALFKFKDNDIVIPILVIEEIDRFKKELSELGRNARQFSRYMDQLRCSGSLATGVILPGGGKLVVDLCQDPVPLGGLIDDSIDNRIIKVAVSLGNKRPERPVVFISKDTNVRIKADAYGLLTVDYDDVKLRPDELYTGSVEQQVPGEQIDRLYSQGELEPSGAPLHPNEFLLLRNQDRPNNTALGRYHAGRKRIVPVKKYRDGVWSLQPRNKEQVFAIDLLLDDDLKLVTLVGKAGTGKTLLAIAAGLHKVEEGRYHRLVVSRPIFPLGRDIGYLPGDIDEKLTPWMKPIYDNVEYLMGLRREGASGRKGTGRGYEELISQGLIEIEPLTYIRGRSLPNQYLVVDEAQNLTPHEIKTIITRAGENTKVVLTGDSQQIDNPYVDATNNGLTYVVERFKDEAISGHISLVKGERSELAELAANLL